MNSSDFYQIGLPIGSFFIFWQIGLSALNAGQNIHALFVDISKAFDRVDHGLLQVKLEASGGRGVELNWFASYLENRHIRTVVNDALSTLLSLSNGILQGSVLGPLLFVIYIRDIPESVKSPSAMFADDTLIYEVDCSQSRSTCALRCDCHLLQG